MINKLLLQFYNYFLIVVFYFLNVANYLLNVEFCFANIIIYLSYYFLILSYYYVKSIISYTVYDCSDNFGIFLLPVGFITYST